MEHLCSKHEAALCFLIDCDLSRAAAGSSNQTHADGGGGGGGCGGDSRGHRRRAAVPGSVCVIAVIESEALTPSHIFLSSVLALPQRDRKPQVLAHHQHHHQ